MLYKLSILAAVEKKKTDWLKKEKLTLILYKKHRKMDNNIEEYNTLIRQIKFQ